MVLRQSALVVSSRPTTLVRVDCIKKLCLLNGYKRTGSVSIRFMHTRKYERLKSMSIISSFYDCSSLISSDKSTEVKRFASRFSPQSLLTALDTGDYSYWDQIIQRYSDINYGRFDRIIQAKLYDYILNSPPEYHKELGQIADSLVSIIVQNDVNLSDFSFRSKCYLMSNKIEELSTMLCESIDILPNDDTLLLLKQTIDDILMLEIPEKQSISLNLFCTVLLRQYGHLQFIDKHAYNRERKLLTTILIGGSESPSQLVHDYLKKNDNFFGSALATTALFIFNHELKSTETALSQAMEIWQIKKEFRHARPADLSFVMNILFRHDEQTQALEIYQNHYILQRDWQFDIVLKCHAANKDWAGLQSCFESLFGRGDLPNLEHYRIVISALSDLGRTDIVDLLFDGLVTRKFSPTTAIFNSMLYTRFAFGSYKLALEMFHKMSKFNVEPNNLSYLIMLMMYRDTKDINGAMSLIQEMLNKNIDVTVKNMSIILDLCANKRDVTTAKGVWKWIKMHGIKPDVVLYSSFMASYLSINNYEGARLVYDEMIEQGLTPTTSLLSMFLMLAARLKDEKIVKWVSETMETYGLEKNSKWIAGMLFYFGQQSEVDAATLLFNELKEANDKQTSPDLKLSVRHYGIMLDIYVRYNQVEEAEDLFEEMKQRDITPSFKTQMTYLMLLSRKLGRSGDMTRMEILEDFLQQGKNLLDLTSDVVPRNTIPAKMLKIVVKDISKNDDQAARLFISQFIEAHYRLNDFPEDYKVYVLMLDVLNKGQRWADVQQYWDLFINALQKRCLVPVELENGEKKMMIPRRYGKSYWQAIDSMLNKMAFYQQQAEMMDFVDKCADIGLIFNGRNYNTLVKGLVKHDHEILEGWKIAEEQLLSFKKYKLSKSARKAIFSDVRRAVERQSVIEKCTLTEAYDSLGLKYPRVMKSMETLQARRNRIAAVRTFERRPRAYIK